MGICKVCVMREEDGFKAWYNGAGRRLEEIGLAVHPGFELWPEDPEHYVPGAGIL